MLENIRYKIKLAVIKKKYYFNNIFPYVHAARVFDFFSQKIFQPELFLFRKQLIELLQDKISITDIGAGTGLLAQQLLERQPSAKITIIEPSPDMISEILQRNIKNIHHYGCTLQDCWDYLPPQDLLIFQRSLFHFPNYEQPLQGLAKILFKLTKNDGTVAIYDDFKSQIDIKHIYSDYNQRANKSNLHTQFYEFWPYYETALKKYIRLGKKGELTAINPLVLKKCFENAGFKTTKWQEDSSIIAFFHKS